MLKLGIHFWAGTSTSKKTVLGKSWIYSKKLGEGFRKDLCVCTYRSAPACIGGSVLIYVKFRAGLEHDCQSIDLLFSILYSITWYL